MAFDSLTTYAVVRELQESLQEARVDKIYQPDDATVIFNLRAPGGAKRLLMTIQASGARIHLTDIRPENPLSPPMFCMLLRKHLQGARLFRILQFHLDRIVELQFETVNELGDLVKESLVIEMMGKHSNLLLVDEDGLIIDAMRRVGPQMSTVRIVLPQMPYELPVHSDRFDPMEIHDKALFLTVVSLSHDPLPKALYQTMSGFSPLVASELLYRAGIPEGSMLKNLTEDEKTRLFQAHENLFGSIGDGRFSFQIYLDEAGAMKTYSVFQMKLMAGMSVRDFETVSQMLDVFYQKQDLKYKMHQKSADISRLVSNHLDRARRKAALQQKQLQDTASREKDRIAADLITANIYRLEKGMKSCELENYYEEGQPLLKIRLDEQLTPAENAQKYYQRYNKLKRTEQALTEQLKNTREEIAYLESIEHAIGLSEQEQDLENLREELQSSGYIRRKRTGRQKLKNSAPLSFTTSEGVRVLVGKNNIQNDQLTFRQSDPDDIWMHVREIPGSHVILCCADLKEGKDYTEASLVEAARIAAAHSRASSGSQVPVDYTFRRYVKKPQGARPGFVRYTHQKTLFVTPELS